MDAISGNADLQLTINRLNPMAIGRPGAHGDGAGAEAALNSFGDLLKSELSKIEAAQTAAGEAVQTYAAGGDIELHQVMTAVEKADLSLQFAAQARNRIVGAYQELSRMQV